MSYWTWFLSAFLLAFQFRENGFCHKCLCIYTFECYCSPVISFTILWTINKHRKLHLADVAGSFSIEKLTSNVQHFFFQTTQWNVNLNGVLSMICLYFPWKKSIFFPSLFWFVVSRIISHFECFHYQSWFCASLNFLESVWMVNKNGVLSQTHVFWNKFSFYVLSCIYEWLMNYIVIHMM